MQSLFLSDLDSPADRFMEFVAGGHPFPAHMGASIGDQTRQFGMVSENFPRQVERVLNSQDCQRVPSRLPAAAEDHRLRFVGGKRMRKISPGAPKMPEPHFDQDALEREPELELPANVGNFAMHGTPP